MISQVVVSSAAQATARTVAQSAAWGAMWLAWLLLMTAAGWPLLARLMPANPGRGLFFAPAFGWMIVTYLAWLASSLRLAPFGAASLIGSVAVVAALSVASELASRGAATRWLRRNIGLALGVVLLLAALFALFAWVRGYAPDVRSTEKPMELGFLGSAMRSPYMPPNDPWWAGAGINYYYFGYTQAAALGLLAAVEPETAFNLTGITLFALTFVGACGVVFDLLARARRERVKWPRISGYFLPALLGGFLVAMAGNAYAIFAALGNLEPGVGKLWWYGVGWNSSRVITDAIAPQVTSELITEFPAFSFLLGDNHPHVLALPTVLLAVGVALAWWWRPFGSWRHDWFRLVLTALVVGVLYPLNAWDLPVYGGVVAAAFLLRRPGRWRVSLVTFAAVGAGAVVLFLPYILGYRSPVGDFGGNPPLIQELTRYPVLRQLIQTFGVVVWTHTPLGGFLTVFALPYLAVGCLFLRGLVGRQVGVSADERRRLTITGVALVLVALVTNTPMLFPAGLLLGMGYLAARRPLSRRPAGGGVWNVWSGTDRAATLVALMGVALPVVPEFFFLRDAFNNRMNTVFKVDYQAWVLLMLVGAYGIVTLVGAATRAARGWRPQARAMRLAGVWATVLVFGAATVAYPLLATSERTGQFGRTGEFGEETAPGWRGLDGFGYATQGNPDELAAVEWLRDNAVSGDRLVEAVGRPYGETAGWFDNRFSVSTGVPTVLGWTGHENQWRGADPRIRNVVLPERERDVRTFYETANAQAATGILQKYDVRWVIVGNQERVRYGGCPPNTAQCAPVPTPGFAKFRDLLPLAFERGGVAIYRVPDGG